MNDNSPGEFDLDANRERDAHVAMLTAQVGLLEAQADEMMSQLKWLHTSVLCGTLLSGILYDIASALGRKSDVSVATLFTDNPHFAAYKRAAAHLAELSAALDPTGAGQDDDAQDDDAQDDDPAPAADPAPVREVDPVMLKALALQEEGTTPGNYRISTTDAGEVMIEIPRFDFSRSFAANERRFVAGMKKLLDDATDAGLCSEREHARVESCLNAPERMALYLATEVLSGSDEDVAPKIEAATNLAGAMSRRSTRPVTTFPKGTSAADAILILNGVFLSLLDRAKKYDRGRGE